MRAVLVLWVAPAIAFAQPTVDILHQDIAADLTAGISITTTVRVSLTEATPVIYLPTPGFPSASATWDGVDVALETVPDVGGQAVMIAPAATDAGEHELVLTLGGAPQCRTSTYDVCSVSADEVFLLPDGGGPAFYAMNFYYDDAFTAAFTIRAPMRFEVIAGQSAPTAIDDNGDGSRTWHYAAEVPVTPMAIYARAAERIESSDGRVIGFCGASVRDAVAAAVDLSAEILPAHERNFGALPVTEAHLLVGSGHYPFGGMGLLGNVLFPEIIFSPDYSYLIEQGMAHELAHSWWGGIASYGSDVPAEQAIVQEAFAEYSAWRALGDLRGAQARVAGVRMNSVWYMYRRPGDEDVAPLDADPSTPLFIFLVYHKSSSFLRMLEANAGVDPFTRALRAMLARGAGSLTLQALADALMTEGYDASADIDAWMRHAGFAHLDVTPTRTAGGLDLDVQSDFAVRLPIAVRFADGAAQDELVDVGIGQTHRSLALDRPPASIELDPDWTFVREVRPAVRADVTLDGRVDGADLLEVALRRGAYLPDTRRVDGSYDPLFDVDGSRRVDDADVAAVIDAAR